MRILLSIITPTYNRGYIIWKTIQSVQSQTYRNWELLVVDDGSIDNTEKVLAQFQRDGRIKYVKIFHKGSQYARNEGLKLAKGEIITYVDSDDFIYDNFLATALDFFKVNSSKVFATSNYKRNIEFYDIDHRLIEYMESSPSQKDTISISDLYKREIKTCGTGIFHRSTIKQKGIQWDTKIKIFQDWDFILQLAQHYANGYMYIPSILFEYHKRYGIEGISANATYKSLAEGFEMIYQKYKHNPLMRDQAWYPKNIRKYSRLQQLVDEKKIKPLQYDGLRGDI